METVIYGKISEGLEIVNRNGRYYLRYDAGAHQVVWREDEISEIESKVISAGGNSEYSGVLAVQNRLTESGVNPNVQNWWPKNA